MHVFEAIPKRWGNSTGITIPKEVLEKEQISPKKKAKFIAIGNEMGQLKRTFGSLKLKKATQKAMDEIDEGYD